jgi:hypothetical protein
MLEGKTGRRDGGREGGRGRTEGGKEGCMIERYIQRKWVEWRGEEGGKRAEAETTVSQ